MNLCRNLYRSLCRFLVGDDVRSLPLCRLADRQLLNRYLCRFLAFSSSSSCSFSICRSSWSQGTPKKEKTLPTNWTFVPVIASSIPNFQFSIFNFQSLPLPNQKSKTENRKFFQLSTLNSQLSTASPFILYPLSFILFLLLTGCLSRPALVYQNYALHTSSPEKRADSSAQGILSVRNVQVSPLFERRSFVYRTGPDRYELDPFAEFMVLPSRALAIPVRSYLRGSGVFQDVTEPGSELMPNSVLELHAQELYGDFRTPGQPAAVLTIRMLLFDSETGQQKLLFQKAYSQRVPLKERSATALAAGWNQALTQIMSEAVNDFASVHTKTASQ